MPKTLLLALLMWQPSDSLRTPLQRNPTKLCDVTLDTTPVTPLVSNKTSHQTPFGHLFGRLRLHLRIHVHSRGT